MFIALALTSTSGCYMANGGNVSGNIYGFKTLEDAKRGMEALVKAQNSNAYLNNAPLIIMDMDTLEVVSSVRRVPALLPWEDRR